jgi:hypothetical protein
VEQLSVRRWIAASPDEVWPHVLDLTHLVEDDRALDLEDLVGDHATGTVPGVGSSATIIRRSGPRVERLVLHVEERVEPDHVTLAVTAGGERWLLSITLTPLPGDHGCGCDVRLHLERDPAGTRGRGPRSLAVGRGHRTIQSLSTLLDGLARQLEGRSGRRIPAGR